MQIKKTAKRGRQSKWNHTPTIQFRVPEAFCEQLTEIAEQLDQGNRIVRIEWALNPDSEVVPEADNTVCISENATADEPLPPSTILESETDIKLIETPSVQAEDQSPGTPVQVLLKIVNQQEFSTKFFETWREIAREEEGVEEPWESLVLLDQIYKRKFRDLRGERFLEIVEALKTVDPRLQVLSLGDNTVKTEMVTYRHSEVSSAGPLFTPELPVPAAFVPIRPTALQAEQDKNNQKTSAETATIVPLKLDSETPAVVEMLRELRNRTPSKVVAQGYEEFYEFEKQPRTHKRSFIDRLKHRLKSIIDKL